MDPTDYLAKNQLYADPNERLLICCQLQCGYALSIAGSQVTSHLREKHGISKDLRKGLTQYLQQVLPYEFRDPTSVPARPDGSPTHPKLQLHDGYACRLCRYWTINPFIMS
jgi:hypothetical protein